MDSKHAFSLQELINFHESEIRDHTSRAKLLKEELVRICTHPDNMVKHTENYVSGSYNDTACTYHYYHCGICGIKLREETESHSWYG